MDDRIYNTKRFVDLSLILLTHKCRTWNEYWDQCESLKGIYFYFFCTRRLKGVIVSRLVFAFKISKDNSLCLQMTLEKICLHAAMTFNIFCWYVFLGKTSMVMKERKMVHNQLTHICFMFSSVTFPLIKNGENV